MLYERLRRLTASTQGAGGLREWQGMLTSTGTAKCIASLITYPHEVRHPNAFFLDIGLTYNYFVAGSPNAATTTPRERDKKYTGLIQTLRLVIAEKGARSLYRGLSASLYARCSQRYCHVFHL